jgi:hypothetical protein
MDHSKRWRPPSTPLISHQEQTPAAPIAVKVAVACFICDALGIPILSQAWVSPMPFDLGKDALMQLVYYWGQAPVMLVAVALISWRRPWPRVALGLLVALGIADYLVSGSVAGRFANFPRAVVRDCIDFVLQAMAVLLSFTPAASRWYQRSEGDEQLHKPLPLPQREDVSNTD